MYKAHAYSFRMHTADISCSLYRPIHLKRFDIGVNIFYILFNLFINAIIRNSLIYCQLTYGL